MALGFRAVNMVFSVWTGIPPIRRPVSTFRACLMFTSALWSDGILPLTAFILWCFGVGRLRQRTFVDFETGSLFVTQSPNHEPR